MKIPPGETVVNDSRLTLIKILSELTKDGGRLQYLKEQVKARLTARKARFAASDAVNARLQPAKANGDGEQAGRKFVKADDLHALIKAGDLTLKEFLDCACIRTSQLPKYLSGKQIDELLTPAEESDEAKPLNLGALYTEFKDGITFDHERIESAILDAFATPK
jgi:hypothetical protein